MQGRLENQIKIEEKIEDILKELPKEVSDYYINFSASREFRSCYAYVTKLRKFLLWYAKRNKIKVKDVDVTKIDDSDIARYMKFIEKKQTEESGVISYTSFSYRKQIWSVLNSFFSFLDKKRFIENNPVRLVDYPNKKDNVDHVFLSKDDLNKIIKTIQNGAGNKTAINRQDKWKERDLAIFYTLMYTGMRESALCEMNIQSIDFDNYEIEVIDKEHKTNKYTMNMKLKKALLEWLDKREELLEDVSIDALFVSRQRKRIQGATVRELIYKYSQEALGYKVGPHRIRAAFGNMIYEETGDIQFTSLAMKHANIETTRIYMESDENKVNNKVADLLSNIL